MYEIRAYGGMVKTTGNKITGLASPVWDGTRGTEYELSDDGGMVERFAPGAFTEYLRGGPAVFAKIDHRDTIGKTPKTLQVWEERDGLHYTIDPPDTAAVRELRAKIESGIYEGSSISFRPVEATWERDGGKDVRLIKRATLKDVSVVLEPAYSATHVGLRSLEERAAIEQERDEHFRRLTTEYWLLRVEEKDKKPYGDVDYADPKNGKYPIDTEAHIRAAWSYINMPKNQAGYTSSEVASIKEKIVAAWKKKIDKDGPPGAEK
jgi:HK97 family phage prohead protease